MAALLVIAHAPLASSLRAVAAHVYPDCGRGLAALDVEPGMQPEQVVERARALLAELGAQEALILVDVFGATPCNAALELADGVSARVVAGVNVPMLWRTLCYAHLPLDELVARAVAGGTQGVMQIGGARRQNQAVSPGPHDQDPHHHQQ
ncbi:MULTISPECIES: PTS sugar transporter subunit IIA [Rubrivivax]|uniref:PTS fructose transporter subunit IIA n=2 Tax=Rubrivivax benzoatilyticus TaxID=316997 RepID=A0ABX0HYM9_9BURK|nr:MULTISPECIES: PTS fructose transporter subunit IIA [Rubrivivax]MCD0422445.1 PTS fructose transporter subunit IIA [Rubrivivax sp. JA1024]EGJ11883.1 PTS system fructose subfamily transporter subunit IIA [Rubrivivax benzoatilyticus JA2 = ATCC BAA-35]MCC9596466.1 PTS fructose transporter subunit IIA [Rubrivivax sp. JA1055]MCC9648621.1 PTS fructose transporter subunit IIA [Rubrivivax sp. JA1029]NHL00116.1 PTS fructose transporter subunit IIA [Rubrivivax benzoatilyticus]